MWGEEQRFVVWGVFIICVAIEIGTISRLELCLASSQCTTVFPKQSRYNISRSFSAVPAIDGILELIHSTFGNNQITDIIISFGYCSRTPLQDKKMTVFYV